MAMAVKPSVGQAPRQCARKVKYVSQLAAADGLIRLAGRISLGQVRDPNPTRPLNIYPCSHCSCWHIGHEPEFA